MIDVQDLYRKQDWIVINQLTNRDKMLRSDAIRLWYTSKTREYIQDINNNLSFVSGMRCYW